jgi:hypothetical protein
LSGRRQIDPELQAVNGDAFGGDLVVDQSAAGGHPLHVAGQYRAFMPLIIVVIDAALDDIGHGLDPTMRVLVENTSTWLDVGLWHHGPLVRLS